MKTFKEGDRISHPLHRDGTEFEDIQKGDQIRITRTDGDTLTTVQGVAAYKTSGLSNDYWLTEQGVMLVTRLERGAIAIITKNALEGS